MTDANFVSAMTTATQSGTKSVTYTGVTGGTGIAADKTALGQDAFLQLLVTQLKNQDPSSPMDSTQIVAQTAQLSTVQQLTSLTTLQQNAFDLQQRLSASSLVGKQVSYQASDGSTASGVVDATSFTAGKPTLSVGGKAVDFAAVTAVRAAAVPTTADTTTTTPATADTDADETPTTDPSA